MKLEIITLPLSKLKLYDRNARKHTEKDIEILAENIQTLGFNDPIGIWSDKNIIVEGHGRYYAAKLLGIKEVPCIRLDHLSDEGRRAYALAHNKTGELSSWNYDLYRAELDNIKGIDVSALGLNMELSGDSFDDFDTETEISLEDFDNGRFRCKCPECGFRFNP